ncbi:LysM peptidoglycan-binding domain-containing protein [Pseudonocardia sp. GCM10023141]|uniref:LysM peptidoglycan-binding domain-containing protein n=1 Tax=Pseudonocardia sp. GCM10023141 TaxID=3252653 RepID=UPI00360AE2B4
MNLVARVATRIVSAMFAGAVVLGIVVGVPILLWMVIVELVAIGLPKGASLIDLTLRPDDGTLLMGFLAIVGVGAWLILTISIISEIVATVAGRPAPRITVPGFGWGRSIAAALVAAMLGAAPAVAAPAAVSTTSVSPVEHPQAAAEPARSEHAADDGPVHLVVHRDTLWRIAQVALGDPMRWREIFELNVGRIQPDGGRLTEASDLTVGWRLLLPADARDTLTVQPGDTLWDLAAEHLGDPGRSADLFRANVTTAQPGGAVLTDPDEIRPGWILRLPGPDGEEIAVPPAVALPSPRAPGPPPTTIQPTPEPAAPSAASRPSASVGVPERDAPSGVPETSRSAAPSSPMPTPAQRPPSEPETRTETDEPAWSTVSLGMSALVASGVIASLAVRRRRQLRHRPFRHRVTVPSDEVGRAEWSMTNPGPATEDTQSAAQRLDLALRAHTHPDFTVERPVTQIHSVRLTDADVLLATAEGELPAPFLETSDVGMWGLDVDTDLPAPAEELAGYCAPFPTLVSVGTDDVRTLMIDLEGRGVLHLGGDPARCHALLRHIAAELATGSMAEDCEILLVGMGDELTALDPDRLRATDLGTACDELRYRTAATVRALEEHQLSSAVEGRLRGIAADSWLPTIVLVGPGDNEPEQLRKLEAQHRPGTATAVVVIDPAAPDIVITEDGIFELADVDDGPWQATQLTTAAGTHLAAVLATTTAPAEPVGKAGDAHAWADGMDDDGGLSDDPPDESVGGDEHSEVATTADSGDDLPDVELPQPRKPVVSSESATRLAIVDFQDPLLDEDLKVWLSDETPPVPLIAILGEPFVRAPGLVPTTRLPWFAEVLVYLSLHPAGVSPSKAVTDLWPEGQLISPATVRHAFYGARRWAGRGLGGDPGTAFVSDMQYDSIYRLRGHLLDWDLFRRLRKRGQARHAAGHSGATADYTAALDLVRGPVLTPLRPGGYAWLNNHEQRHDLQIPGFLIDAAHELVDIALDADDTATARWAAEHARLVDVDVAYDRPLTDLMRIAHAEDNQTELELYAAVLLDARGFDVPEELAPDSYVVLHDLLPMGPRRPRS